MHPTLKAARLRSPMTLALALIMLTAVVPTAQANCHPVCVPAVDDHVEEAANLTTGHAYTLLEASSRCNGTWIAWSDWTAEHDADCDGLLHGLVSTHGSTLGIAAAARVLRGSLSIGTASTSCLPATGSDGTSCTIALGVVTRTPRCVHVTAGSLTNTGHFETVQASGPWTTC